VFRQKSATTIAKEGETASSKVKGGQRGQIRKGRKSFEKKKRKTTSSRSDDEVCWSTVLRRRAENKVSFLQSIQAAVYEHETKNEIQKI
jgi:RIO-like serine/threonine protein kinase